MDLPEGVLPGWQLSLACYVAQVVLKGLHLAKSIEADVAVGAPGVSGIVDASKGISHEANRNMYSFKI